MCKQQWMEEVELQQSNGEKDSFSYALLWPQVVSL